MRRRGGGSGLGDKQADASGDVVGGGFVGSGLDELHRVADGIRAQDEAAGIEIEIAEQQRVAEAHGEKSEALGFVAEQRIVMAVDEGDGAGRDQGSHGRCLMVGDADGDESLPVAARGGTARAKLLEYSRGETQRLRGDGSGDVRSEECDRVRDEGDDVGSGLPGDPASRRLGVIGQKIGGGEHLRGENTVEGFQAEGAFLVEEV